MEHILLETPEFKIGVDKGNKSELDFKVKYKEAQKNERTPKHIHLMIDILLKRQGNPELTQRLIRFFNEMLEHIEAADEYPPRFQIYRPGIGEPFKELSEYGDYDVEFLIAIFELIMIQEKTNYPAGTLNLKLFKRLEEGADIFTLVSAATFR